MSIMTFEGIVNDGLIKLRNGARLPDNTTVYVIVPNFQIPLQPHVSTPRLANPDQLPDFVMEVFDGPQLTWDEYRP